MNLISTIFSIFTKYMNLVSLGISILAAIFTAATVYYAGLAWLDSRKLAGLDFSPELELEPKFHKSPPEFVISNNGPVEATYAEVEQVWHYYENGKIVVSIAQGQGKYMLAKIVPKMEGT